MAINWNYTEDKKRVVLPDGKPSRIKKITGTRFASILGLNPYTSPFQAWCEMTGVAKIPFEDTMYTLAGKEIEPKVIDYCKDVFSPHDTSLVVSPQEFYGNRYEQVKYDFYPTVKRFGGMWDSKILRKDKQTARALIEIKTTKRVEDWKENPPVYYLLQLMLYAYLENVDTVYMVASFLVNDDYNNPSLYVPTENNTIIMPFKVSEFRLEIDGMSYNIGELVDKANDWYDTHIENAISPEFDELKDKQILDVLRTNKPENDLKLDDMMMLAESLEERINEIKKMTKLDELEKELKLLKDGIKTSLLGLMTDNDTKIDYHNYALSRSIRAIVDKNKMIEDGIYESYITDDVTYRLTKTKTKN